MHVNACTYMHAHTCDYPLDKLNPGPHDNNKLEQIQHRVLSYTENWPSMRRWFSKFKVVRNIDADMELAVVCRGASAAVQEVINSVSGSLPVSHAVGEHAVLIAEQASRRHEEVGI